MKESTPQSVEITLSSGRVMHYKDAFGDKITMQRVVTQPTGTSATNLDIIEYVSLVIVPRARGQKDAL